MAQSAVGISSKGQLISADGTKRIVIPTSGATTAGGNVVLHLSPEAVRSLQQQGLLQTGNSSSTIAGPASETLQRLIQQSQNQQQTASSSVLTVPPGAFTISPTGILQLSSGDYSKSQSARLIPVSTATVGVNADNQHCVVMLPSDVILPSGTSGGSVIGGQSLVKFPSGVSLASSSVQSNVGGTATFIPLTKLDAPMSKATLISTNTGERFAIGGEHMESASLLLGKDRFKRKRNHNEVEKRRRDKINTWIGEISAIVPGLSAEGIKMSKSLVLSKTVEYIHDLQTTNEKLFDAYSQAETIISQADTLQRQIDDLRAENNYLRERLAEAGISVPSISSNVEGSSIPAPESTVTVTTSD